MLVIFWTAEVCFRVRHNVNKIFQCFDFTTKWRHERTGSTWREYVFCELITWIMNVRKLFSDGILFSTKGTISQSY